jgi:anti-sigma factor RsiW
VPDHPDHEQLAAFQAGDGDRRQRSDVEAHLAGCPACAEVVASVEQARRRLAVLEEPQLPPGLHDRLAAAVAGGAAAEPVRRPTPWYRRPVAWGAAAALLLAALVVPLLDQSGERLTAGNDGGGGGAASELAQAPEASAAAQLPVIQLPGEVSAAAVRSRLAADARASRALASAGAGTRSSAGGPETAAGPTQAAPPKGQAGADQAGEAAPSTLAGAANLQSCLPAATAAADPTVTPLTPAFFVEGTYQGRPVTVLVTTSSAQPGRVDLWVFPRANCTAPPLATERVR